MGVVAIPALLIGALVISVAIAIKNQQNNSKPGSSSPSDVFDDLDKVFKRQETSCVLNCDKGSGKLETPIHQPDTRPYVNPPYFDDELDAYVHPMQPDEDLDKYTYIKPGVYYDPETGRYVTPIHQGDATDLVYNSENLEYAPTDKHKKGGWGTEMDLDDATAQEVLNNSIQSGKQRYGYKDGKPYEFQPDNQAGWHGYPLEGTESSDIPVSVLREMRDRGDFSQAEYKKILQGRN